MWWLRIAPRGVVTVGGCVGVSGMGVGTFGESALTSGWSQALWKNIINFVVVMTYEIGKLDRIVDKLTGNWLGSNSFGEVDQLHELDNLENKKIFFEKWMMRYRCLKIATLDVGENRFTKNEKN